MLDLAITGATVVTPERRCSADVGIKRRQDRSDRRHRANLEPTAKTIDARGMLLLPGAVDPHTHLDAEMFGATTADDFESGTIAAAAGGVTSDHRLCVSGGRRIAERGDFEVG